MTRRLFLAKVNLKSDCRHLSIDCSLVGWQLCRGQIVKPFISIDRHNWLSTPSSFSVALDESSALTYNNNFVDAQLMARAKQVNQSFKRFALGPGVESRDSASLNRLRAAPICRAWCTAGPGQTHSRNGEKEKTGEGERVKRRASLQWPTCLSKIIWHCRQDLNRDPRRWRRNTLNERTIARVCKRSQHSLKSECIQLLVNKNDSNDERKGR